MTIRKILLVVAVTALLSAAHTVMALSIDFGPTPKPGPALAERLALHDCEVYGIVHWGLNTYTDREWGYGDEDPALLNPAKFDADQIVGACKAGGLGGLIVVAKHHDGFCLWPTKTTEYNITKTPFWKSWSPKLELENEKIPLSNSNSKLELKRETGRDYLKEMERACRKARLKFGVYISPWDRHDADYATPAYVEKYHAQIKELLSGDYGKIFEMWFDGANGGDGWYGGAKDRRRIGVASDYYRFPEVFKFVRELQPKACIFAGESDDSDFRWPGNERGELDPNSCATICTVGGFADGKYGNPEYKKHINIGMRNFEGAVKYPMFFRVCECDFPMRPGWFYHAKEKGKTKSGIYLLKRYLNTVGNGGTMNLGIAPNKDGLLDDEDVKALADFGKLKAAFFSKPITNGLCNVVVMSEDVVSHGETCDEWLLYENDKKEPWDWQLDDGRTLAYGKNIGIKRIRTLDTPRPAERLHLNVYGDGAEALPMKFYYVEPEFLKAVISATTESGETDTAKWMTAGKQGAAPKELTVATDGMSPNDALLAIRAAKGRGDWSSWTVHVKPGVYVLKEPLVFTPADSGTPEAPVRWVGDGGEAVFSGGEPLADWRDEGNGVWSAPIPKTPSGERAYFEQLWVNGRRADRARLPDGDSANPISGCLRIANASITPVKDAAGKTTYIEHVTPSNAAALATMQALFINLL